MPLPIGNLFVLPVRSAEYSVFFFKVSSQSRNLNSEFSA